jgi:membrane protein
MVSRMFRALLDGFEKHDLMTLSGALAFYTSLSLAPLLLLMVAGISFMGPTGQEQFMLAVENLVGPQASLVFAMIINNVDQQPSLGNFAGVIGIGTLLFSASSVFAQMHTSLNFINEVKPVAGSSAWRMFLRRRILSMGLVVGFSFLTTVSLMVSTVMAATLPRGDIWKIINDLISLIVFAALFSSIFKFLPDKHLPWRHCAVGGMLTALLFTIGKILIGVYLGESALGSAYGAAGSLIALLAWVYYSSMIVFVGAELTRALSTAPLTTGARESVSP